MKPGDPVTVWIGGVTDHGRFVRGRIYDSDNATRSGMNGLNASKPFSEHMNERVKNGLSRLHEWFVPKGGINTVRLIDEKDQGIVWLPGWSDEIDRALIAARALM